MTLTRGFEYRSAGKRRQHRGKDSAACIATRATAFDSWHNRMNMKPGSALPNVRLTAFLRVCAVATILAVGSPQASRASQSRSVDKLVTSPQLSQPMQSSPPEEVPIAGHIGLLPALPTETEGEASSTPLLFEFRAADESTELSPTWEQMDARFEETLNDSGMRLVLNELDDEIDSNPSLRDLSFVELSRLRWEQLSSDYGHFYSARNLGNLAIGFAVGAAMANTNFDESLSHDFFQENFVDIANEDVTEKLHQPKLLGDGYILLPLIGGAALAEPWLESSPVLQPIGEWGNRSARAILVGGPLVMLMQRVVGGSRPNESDSLSHWEPFQDNNGVSGHSFVGAVPFLSAAEMTDSKWLKALCFAGSVLPGISRINDERHYFSQVFLGWYVAYLSCRAVDVTQTGRDGFRIFPTIDQNGFGLLLDKRF